MAGTEAGSNCKYKLRQYQQDAVDCIVKDIAEHQSCSAVLPTGAGKSLIFIELIDILRKELGIDKSILVLCHLTDPLHQLFDSYQSLGARPARLKFWEGQVFPSIHYDIIFSSMQKMSMKDSLIEIKTIQKRKMFRHPKYIFIDEAHSFGALSYKTICELFPTAKVIGLSATPFRSNRYSFGLFEKVSFTISMDELIQQGFLTQPKTEQVEIPASMDSDGGRIALSYKIWKERERGRGLVTIVYFPTTEIAKSALASFTQSGACRTKYIDGSTKVREAKRILESARKGEIDVIVNCQKLETGIDIPNIGAVIQPYPVGSVVRYMQRVGRALRLHPGKKHAMIYLCGTAPAIEKGDWIALHKKAIRLRDPLPSEALWEEINEDDCNYGKQKMEWTKEAIEACKLLENNDLVTLSQFLASKRFPAKYDKFIKDILARARPTEGYDDSPVSVIQAQIITERYNLEERHVNQLTKKEASAIINGFQDHLDSDPFIIQSGKHLGKHPSNMHSYARKWCQGDTKRTLQAWWKAGRPPIRKGMGSGTETE